MDPFSKKTILICSPNEANTYTLKKFLDINFSDCPLYLAETPQLVHSKATNAIPDIVFLDSAFDGPAFLKLTKWLLNLEGKVKPCLIMIGQIPAKGILVDEVIDGRVQFVEDLDDSDSLTGAMERALNTDKSKTRDEMRLRIFPPMKIVMNQGESGDRVYIVKSGELEAVRTDVDGKSIALGKITVGEFVGEMAYINGEPRSANVVTLTRCELIEIPAGMIDTVLLKRPNWAKAMMRTLSKRLKALAESKN